MAISIFGVRNVPDESGTSYFTRKTGCCPMTSEVMTRNIGGSLKGLTLGKLRAI